MAPVRIVYLVVLVILVASFRLTVVVGRRKDPGGKVIPSPYTIAWEIVRNGIFLAVFAEFLFCGREIPPALLAGGAVIALGGIWLRRRAALVLGRFYSLKMRTFDDHRVVCEGPYAYVRHPLYLGYALFVLGLSLTAAAYYSTAAVVIVLVPFLLGRIKSEEKALVAHMGDEYRSYRERVPAFLPLRPFPRECRKG